MSHFEDFLRVWANEHNIRHTALKPLLKTLKKTFNVQLQSDPRTFMRTPRQKHKFIKMQGGEYWHQGLDLCLRSLFFNLNEILSISININIDGLPIYRSGRDEFWPILFKLLEFALVKKTNRNVRIYTHKYAIYCKKQKQKHHVIYYF